MLLDVAPYPVFPPTRGGALAVHHANLAVSAHCQVELISQGLRRDEWRRAFTGTFSHRHAPSYHEERVYTLPGLIAGYLAGQHAGGSMLSANWTLRFSRSARVRELLEGADLLQVEHPWQVPTLARWNAGRRPLVMVAHNVEASVAAQVGRPAREVGAIRTREQDAVAASDAVIAFTDDDRRELIEQAGADPSKVHVIPLGVDTNRLRPAAPEARARAKTALGLEGKRVALFVGSLYEPNVEAVAALFEMASKLDRKDLIFLVVGRVGERFRSNERVRVTGGVADVAPYVAAADLAVNPMRSGGGMQVKLLEFLAAGLPTITTPVGARGLAAKDGEDIMVSELAQFVEALDSLMADDANAARLGVNARRLVESRYGWDAIARERVRLYESLLQTP